jgi:hypothetical protein
MRLIARNKPGNMIQVGNDNKTAIWYLITTQVQNFITTQKLKYDDPETGIPGDEIVIKPEVRDEVNYIVGISKGEASSQQEYAPSPELKKTFTTDESIMKQVILKSVAECVKAISGGLSKEELPQVALDLYDKLYRKVYE